MKPVTSQSQEKYVVEVNWADRWLVYRRLQELGISCSCESNQPLTIEISDVTTAIQLWSVVRSFTAPRQDLIHTLKQCWKSRYKKS
ncbi:MAG: hypothetical protein SAK29_13505 [Scytonema sp. PMC 1069.18]|nr:hypothetical protein [Scytonema sp. PMC 1069.18]MEC4886427.1 hypothetical protein [Scytonema sp. PMC 1070.18]